MAANCQEKEQRRHLILDTNVTNVGYKTHYLTASLGVFGITVGGTVCFLLLLCCFWSIEQPATPDKWVWPRDKGIWKSFPSADAQVRCFKLTVASASSFKITDVLFPPETPEVLHDGDKKPAGLGGRGQRPAAGVVSDLAAASVRYRCPSRHHKQISPMRFTTHFKCRQQKGHFWTLVTD